MLCFHQAASLVDLRTGQGLGARAFERAVQERLAALVPLGLAHGDRVAIRGRGTVSFFVDLFAVWRLRCAAACLSASLTQPEVDRLTTFVGAAVYLDEDGIAVVADREAGEGGREEAPPGIDALALLLFTSGTTGEPKTVALSYRALLARVALNAAELGSDALGSTLNVLPVHFGHGLIGNCLTPLLTGGTLHLLASPGLGEIGQLGTIVGDQRIRFMSSVPSFWTLAARMSQSPAQPILKRVHVGSAPLSTHQWRQIAQWSGTKSVYNAYGITETANWIGGGRMDEAGAGDGYVGRIWGGQWAVAQPDGLSPAQADAEGEVLIASPSLMSGYYRRADLTAAAMTDGWFRTGDIGRLDDDGRLTITGRLKDEINLAGIKVHPEEVDLLLNRHDGVLECCCFAEPDPASGERVAAAIVPAPDADGRVNGRMLADWMAERIRRECIPARWYFIEKIPRTDRGKINRSAVRDFCHAQADALATAETKAP